MIIAGAASDQLIRRLQDKAVRLAKRRAETLRGARRGKKLSWHSSKSLWPTFGLD
jgi:hypothetical protein